MNAMVNSITASWLVALVLPMPDAAAQAPAPRVDGAFCIPFSWSGRSGELIQHTGAGPGDPMSPAKDAVAVWDSATDTYTHFTVPADVAGGCLYLGGGSFLLTGKKSVTQEGVLVRGHLSTGPLAGTIDEVRLLPGFDPGDLYYDSEAQRLFLMNTYSGEVRLAAYSGGGPLPGTFATIANLWRQGDPALAMRGPDVGEAPGVYFMLFGHDWRAPPSTGIRVPLDPHRRLRLWEPSPGTWQLEDLSAKPTIVPIYNGWTIQEPRAVPDIGTFWVTAASGGLSFFVRDEETLMGVYFWQVPALGRWQPVTVPQGVLEVGRKYSLVDITTSIPSSPFTPSYRLGACTSSGSFTLEKGEVHPPECLVGNGAFTVGGNLRWASIQSAPSGVPQIYVLAAVDEPNAGAVTTLPTGETILAHPVVSILFPWSTEPHPEFGIPATVAFPIPGDEGVVGAPILFQWIAFLPNGTAIVSDVFGSRVLAAATAQARSSIPSAGSASNHRLGRARQWLRGLEPR